MNFKSKPTIIEIRPIELGDFEKLLDSKIVVVIPAYNEERLIGSVVLKLKEYSHNIIVVDDGSSDDTSRIAASAGAVVYRQSPNQGKGIALNLGFMKAREMDPDVVVAIDADGQHYPNELPIVIGPVLDGEADIVIGSRYLDERSDVPKTRVLGHRVLNKITHIISGTLVSDSQSGYRAFSPRAIQDIKFSASDFSVEAEMQFIAKEHNWVVKEVPITISYTEPPKRSVWRQGLIVLNGILHLAGQYRPLLYFSVPGGLSILGGLFEGLRVIRTFQTTDQLAIGTAMVSVLLTILGGLMLSTGFILHSVRALLIGLFKLNR